MPNLGALWEEVRCLYGGLLPFRPFMERQYGPSLSASFRCQTKLNQAQRKVTIQTIQSMTRFIPSAGVRAGKTRASFKCAGTFTHMHWHSGTYLYVFITDQILLTASTFDVTIGEYFNSSQSNSRHRNNRGEVK